MRGEFINVWTKTNSEIWSKLARHQELPIDLFSELYREITSALKPPTTDHEILSAAKRLVTANDPVKAKKLFIKIKATDFQGEKSIVLFLEGAYRIIKDELDKANLAEYYFGLVKSFINIYSLRYDLAPPFSLTPTLQGLFVSLVHDLKSFTSSDPYLNSLMEDFENSIRDLRMGFSDTRIKTCISKQMNLLEGMGGQYPSVVSNTLGSICNEVGTFPHVKVKESIKHLYTFTCDYPGIRHGGTQTSVLRSIELRDMITMAVVLVGFTPYLTNQLDTNVIYWRS
jgi:hypothetical protein